MSHKAAIQIHSERIAEGCPMYFFYSCIIQHRCPKVMDQNMKDSVMPFVLPSPSSPASLCAASPIGLGSWRGARDESHAQQASRGVFTRDDAQ